MSCEWSFVSVPTAVFTADDITVKPWEPDGYIVQLGALPQQTKLFLQGSEARALHAALGEKLGAPVGAVESAALAGAIADLADLLRDLDYQPKYADRVADILGQLGRIAGDRAQADAEQRAEAESAEAQQWAGMHHESAAQE